MLKLLWLCYKLEIWNTKLDRAIFIVTSTTLLSKFLIADMRQLHLAPLHIIWTILQLDYICHRWKQYIFSK